MRRLIIPGIALAALLVACEKKTETQTVTDSTGTHEQKTTTYTTTMPAVTVDTAATATAAAEAKEKLKDAAHATGTALEKAGKKIEEKTEPKKKP